LLRISVNGGTPVPLAAGEENACTLAISRQGDSLAYSQEYGDTNIWRLELKQGAHEASRLISSTRQDFGPQYSPDGKRIAFTSARSGSNEVWVCDSEGLNAVQLTSFAGPDVGSPRWSSDGRYIAFDSKATGNRNIYIIGADGGKPRPVTDGTDDVRPSWSRDGRWIYFGSNRNGAWQIWKVAVEGGKAIQVTQQGAREGFESPDGKFLYYSKGFGIPGIWRIPSAGGNEEQVLAGALQGFWALANDGIYFINPNGSTRPAIEFFNFETHKTSQILTMEKDLQLVYPSMAISADGRSLLFVQIDSLESDIMLVQNFR
jgi:Tol biopolymer transport system component